MGKKVIVPTSRGEVQLIEENDAIKISIKEGPVFSVFNFELDDCKALYSNLGRFIHDIHNR